WRDVAAAREKGGATTGGNVAVYANRKYEACILENKKYVYSTIRERLIVGGENLQGRIKRLAEYIEMWKMHAQSGAAGDDQLVTNLPPGTVYPQDIIEDKWKTLTPTVANDSLEPLQRQTRSDAFTGDIPRNDRGGPDLEPFVPIEEQIRT